MITHSCDVCGKTSEPETTEVDGFRAVPVGWYRRPGRVPAQGSAHFHEIVVLCCSQKCCAAYDRVEAEKIGFSWMKIIVVADGDFVSPTHNVKPLKVP
jgi:hypothetical protein